MAGDNHYHFNGGKINFNQASNSPNKRSDAVKNVITNTIAGLLVAGVSALIGYLMVMHPNKAHAAEISFGFFKDQVAVTSSVRKIPPIECNINVRLCV